MQQPVRRNAPSRTAKFHSPAEDSFDLDKIPTLKMVIDSDMMGAVIGKGGRTIRSLSECFGVRIHINRSPRQAREQDREVSIYGEPLNVSKACVKIHEIVLMETESQGKENPVPLGILAYSFLIGRVIGKNGQTIRRICDETDTRIQVPPSKFRDVRSMLPLERLIWISGSVENVGKAQKLITNQLIAGLGPCRMNLNRLAQAFPTLDPIMALALAREPAPTFASIVARVAGLLVGSPSSTRSRAGIAGPLDNIFTAPSVEETTYMYVPNRFVGALIGQGGKVVQSLMSFTGTLVRVDGMPESKARVSDELRLVTIGGKADGQWKAQFFIARKLEEVGLNNMVDPNRYDPTSEFFMVVQIPVPASTVGRLIGKNGNRVSRLQQFTGAKVKFLTGRKNNKGKNADADEDEDDEEEDKTHDEEAKDEVRVQITGYFDAVQKAQRCIRALVQMATGKVNRPPPQKEDYQSQDEADDRHTSTVTQDDGSSADGGDSSDND